jgi:hypothetical protein
MSIITILQGIRDGELVTDLTNKLSDVVEQVSETGKKGSLTLTLDIKKNGEHGITISPKVVAKTPETQVGDALFFSLPGGNLSRKNPKQHDIEDEIARQRAKQEGTND